jgi:acyl-coenzyme A synthetase/AMP-(fatty) acid ligase
MWNFLVHGLSVGCTLVLYDGSPLRDPAFLWTLVDNLGITIFGTSAKYIDQLSVSGVCSASGFPMWFSPGSSSASLCERAVI